MRLIRTITRRTPALGRRPVTALLGMLVLASTALVASASPASASGRFNFAYDFKHETPMSRSWSQGAGKTTIQSACNGPRGYKYTIQMWYINDFAYIPVGDPVTYTCTNSMQQYTWDLAETSWGGSYYFVADKAKDGRKIHISGNVFFA